MAQDTTNYNLKKNENSDDTLVALVTNQSNNMDTIDAKMKENEDKADDNANNTDILRGYATVGGTADAITLTSATAEDFDFTIDGNPIRFIPTADNTGAVTVNVDGNGAVDLLKPDGAGGTTALEAGDLTNGTPVQIDRRVSGDFFFYAPKGGAIVKSVQRGTTSFGTSDQIIDVTISEVVKDNSYVKVNYIFTNDANDDCVSARMLNGTSIRLDREGTGTAVEVNWEVIEYTKLKSRQEGSSTLSGANTSVSISSIDTSKSKIVASFRNTQASTIGAYYNLGYKINSPTQILLQSGSGAVVYSSYRVEWQVLEFE